MSHPQTDHLLTIRHFPLGKMIVPLNKLHEKMCKLTVYEKNNPEPIA